MYACESSYFQKEKQKKVVFKKMGKCAGVLLLILFIFSFLYFFLTLIHKSPKRYTLLEEESIAKIIDSSYDSQEFAKSDEEQSGFTQEYSDESVYMELQEVNSDIPLIIIDPGHGGMDEGCSRDGVEEKTYNLELALMLKGSLEELGFNVLLTRAEDIEMSLSERVEFSLQSKADMLISLHQNNCEYPQAEGIETWYYGDELGQNKRLASLVQKYVILNTDTKSRGIRETQDLYVIRECKIPACLVETGFLSNNNDLVKLQSEEYKKDIVKGISEAVWYYYYPKKMYLTFDDGPSMENTVRILDVLKQRDIQATFFVVGENAEKYPDIIKRIVEDGHSIGIHCYSHSYEEIYKSVDAFIADFEKAKEAVQNIVDVEVWCYRFPGGSINNHNEHIYREIVAQMSEMGYIYFDWNASMEDSKKKATKESIIQAAIESTLQRKKVVMLGHDIVYNTSVCMDDLLDSFPEYEFLPLTKEVSPIVFRE